MRKIFYKTVTILLVAAFVIGRISVSFAYDNFTVSLAAWSQQGSPGFQSDVAGEIEPGAIGRGKPLLRLAQGSLPERIKLSDDEYITSAKEKVQEALEIAIKLAIEKHEDVPNVHKTRAAKTLTNLIYLYQNLDDVLYLFESIVEKPDGDGENYLLGFNLSTSRGLAIDIIHRLYAISPVRLAQYLDHECTPEEGLIGVTDSQISKHLEDHRTVYEEIQTAKYGKVEVNGLKRNLRDVINEKTEPGFEGPIMDSEGREVVSQDEAEALFHIASLLSTKFDTNVSVRDIKKVLKNADSANLVSEMNDFLGKVLKLRVAKKRKGTDFEDEEADGKVEDYLAAGYAAIDEKMGKTIKEEAAKNPLQTLLKTYYAIIDTNKFSPLYQPGDAAAFTVDGQLIARFSGTLTGHEEEVGALSVDEIADLFNGTAGAKAIETLAKINPDYDLTGINYFYDAKHGATYIAAVFSDRRNPEVTTTLGGFRYTYGSMFDKGHHWEVLQKEAEGLAFSMQFKYLSAGLLREGVKWKGIGPRHFKRKILARVAKAATDIGLPSIASAGPDMNVDPGTIGIIAKNMQERYLELLEKELLILRIEGVVINTGTNIDQYEAALREIGREKGITFLMHDLEFRKMREDVLGILQRGSQDVVISENRVVFSSDVKDRFNKILGAMVAGGAWEAGRLPLPDIAPTGFGMGYGFMETEAYLRRNKVVDVVTGKTIDEDTERSEISLRNPGAGDVGGAQAYFAALLGYKVVAVSDEHGVAYCEKGFSKELLRKLFLKIPSERNVTIDLKTEADQVHSDPEKIWDYPATITAPAAIAYQINKTNLEKVAASTNIIIEGANISFAEVVKELHELGVPAVVGWAVNSGGITCCEYEFLLLHAFTPEEVAGNKDNKRTEMLEEMYRDIAYKVTYMSRIVLALQEKNPHLNPTQIAELVVLAIKNKKAEIYEAIRTSGVKGDEAPYAARIRDIKEHVQINGSYMVPEKMDALAITQIAYDEVMAAFAERFGVEKVKMSEGEPKLLTMIREHLAEVNAEFPIPPEEPQVSTAEVSPEEFLPDGTIEYQAQIFKTDLMRLLNKNPDTTFGVAIDIDLGGPEQRSQLESALYDAVREVADLFPKMRCVKGSGESGELMQRLNALIDAGQLNPENIFVIAKNSNVQNGKFQNIEKRAWITGIDDSKDGIYLPVFEAFTLNIMAYLGADLGSIKRFHDIIADEEITIDTIKAWLDRESIALYIVPRAKPMTNDLRKIYKRVRQIYLSV